MQTQEVALPGHDQAGRGHFPARPSSSWRSMQGAALENLSAGGNKSYS